MSALDIFLPAHNGQTVQARYYATAESAGEEYGDESAIREIIRNPACGLCDASVRVFIPGEWVAVHQTTLPRGGRKQAAKLLPALLEDDVGENIEALHFALLTVEDEQAIVAVIQQQKMQEITAWMQAAGITSRTLLPDWMAQPCGTLRIDNARCLFRASTWLGWSCPLTLAPVLLAAQLQLDPRPVTVICPGELPAELAALLPASEASLTANPQPGVQTQTFAASLLWGKWQPRADYRQQWQQWRKVCYALGTGVLLLTAERGLALWSAYSQARQSQHYVEQTFQQLFPAQKRIVNLRAQINSALQSSNPQPAGDEMMALLPQVAATLASMQQQSEVISLKVDQPQQELFLQLRVASYDYFQRFHDAFADAFEVKQNDVQNAGDYVVLGFTLGRKEDEEI